MWTTESINLIDHFTKSGDQIDFSFEWDIEKSTENNFATKSWIVHGLTASVNGKKAGHINIAYIPQNIWDQKTSHPDFPRIVQYLDIFRGHSMGFKTYFMNNRANQSSVSYHEVIQKLAISINYDIYKNLIDLPPTSIERKTLSNKVIDLTIDRHQHRFEKFQNDHVDQPFIDYIEVEENLRRNGIGHALYHMMAHIVCENGFTMLSSNNKSPEGKHHFNAFAKNYPEFIHFDGEHYFIDTNNEDNILMSF